MIESEHSGPAIPARSGVSKPSAIWLISFGDLLTLLLCFFLSIVSFGPLNPNVELPKSDLTTRTNSSALPAEQKITRPGTRFALKTHGRFAAARHFGELKLQIAEEEYTDLGGRLYEAAQQRLIKAVKSDSYRVVAAEVSSCSALSSERSGWFQSVSRALEMRRQLVDAGISAQAVKVRVLGSNCSGLFGEGNARSNEDKLRTQVVLKLKR